MSRFINRFAVTDIQGADIPANLNAVASLQGADTHTGSDTVADILVEDKPAG